MTQVAERINVKSLVVEEPIRCVSPEWLSEPDKKEILKEIDFLQERQDSAYVESVFKLLILAPELKERFTSERDMFFLKNVSSNFFVRFNALKLISPEDFKQAVEGIRNIDFREVAVEHAQKGNFAYLAHYKISFPGVFEQLNLSDFQQFIPEDIQQKQLTDRTKLASELRIIFPEFKRRSFVSDLSLEKLKEFFDGAERVGEWIAALDCAFDLYVLSADRIIVDDFGVHAVYESSAELDIASPQLPEVRRF